MSIPLTMETLCVSLTRATSGPGNMLVISIEMQAEETLKEAS